MRTQVMAAMAAGLMMAGSGVATAQTAPSAFTCPPMGLTMQDASGIAVRYGGNDAAKPNACRVSMLGQMSSLPFGVPGLPDDAAGEVRKRLAALWPLAPGNRASVVYTEPGMPTNAASAAAAWREDWVVSGATTHCLGGVQAPGVYVSAGAAAADCVGGELREAYLVERRREGLLDTASLATWTYTIDGRTNAVLDTAIRVTRGGFPGPAVAPPALLWRMVDMDRP